MEQRTRVVKGMIDREMPYANRPDRGPIYIAWDEYSIWYRARTGKARQGTYALEERYNLEDALVIACFLNGFVRNADCIKMPCMAQLVNVIAPIFTDQKGLFRQTIYFPLQLFAKYVHGQSLDVCVDCPRYDKERFSIGLDETTTIQKGVPYLDVCAAYDQQDLVICVVNRHKENAINAQIICQECRFSGPLDVFDVNGPDTKADNDFGKEVVKTVQRAQVAASGNSATNQFAPHSFTLLKEGSADS